jgi:DNA-binding protein HU-beta
MNKKEFVSNVAAVGGMSVKESETAVNAVLKVITEAMHKEEKILIPGFGSFAVKERPARNGHNPHTGGSMRIPAKKVVRFVPGTGLEIGSRPAGKNNGTNK